MRGTASRVAGNANSSINLPAEPGLHDGQARPGEISLSSLAPLVFGGDLLRVSLRPRPRSCSMQSLLHPVTSPHNTTAQQRRGISGAELQRSGGMVHLFLPNMHVDDAPPCWPRASAHVRCIHRAACSAKRLTMPVAERRTPPVHDAGCNQAPATFGLPRHMCSRIRLFFYEDIAALQYSNVLDLSLVFGWCLPNCMECSRERVHQRPSGVCISRRVKRSKAVLRNLPAQLELTACTTI